MAGSVWLIAARHLTKHSAAAVTQHCFVGPALFGYTTFRHLPARSTEVAPNLAANNELRVLRAINEEIVSLLPLGLLVHDQEANRTVISNKIADHLLPHLNLQNITSMAEQHQGVIQATINNELYEIRLFRSQISSRTQIFIIRDQTAKCWLIRS